MLDKWKRKVDALIRLAEDQAGKPEGDVAKAKLKQILDKHPWAAQEHKPLGDFAVSNLGYMARVGISREGSWTGGNLQHAIALMIADYKQRIESHERLQRMLEGWDRTLDKKLWYSIIIAVSERWSEFDENRSWFIPFRPNGKWRTMQINRNGKSVEIGAYNIPELPGVKLDYNADVDTLVVDVEAIELGIVDL